MDTVFPPGSSILNFNSLNSSEDDPFSAFFDLEGKALQSEEELNSNSPKSDTEESLENGQEMCAAAAAQGATQEVVNSRQKKGNSGALSAGSKGKKAGSKLYFFCHGVCLILACNAAEQLTPPQITYHLSCYNSAEIAKLKSKREPCTTLFPPL